MKIEFTREERIINALMINSYSVDDLGLFHGKMGVVVCFFILGKSKNNTIFSEFAEDLLDNVVESLHSKLPVDFDKGVTGIGWAVEYLIQNKFVDADADDVLEEIDSRVKSVLIHDTAKTLHTVISLGYYYVSRICYRVGDEDNMTVLDFKYNVILLIDEIERQVSAGATHPQLYHLLQEIKKLNVFNFKVDKLLNQVEVDDVDYLFPFIPKLTSCEVELLLSSKDAKTHQAGFALKNIEEDEKWGLKNGIAGICLQKIFVDYDL